MFTTTVKFPCTVQSAAEVHRPRLQTSGSQKTMYFMPFCMYVIVTIFAVGLLTALSFVLLLITMPLQGLPLLHVTA